MPSLFDILFGKKTLSYDKSGEITPTPAPKKQNPLIDLLLGRSQQMLSPLPQATPTPLPSPEPVLPQSASTLGAQSNDFNAQEVERKMRQGIIGQVGDVPLLQYVPDLVKAAQDYEFFRQNPYLLPQVGILETTGGKHVTRPNNLLNWGINYPGNNELFAQVTPQSVLGRAISGIGERSPYYEDVRQTNDLQKFASTYEPKNKDYYRNLIEGIRFFENQ